MDVEPLRVQAILRTAVVADRALPLDGILLYQAMRHKYGEIAEASAPGTTIEGRKADVPLLCHEIHTPNWYFACSWAQWPNHAREGKDYWAKRIATNRMDIVNMGRKSKVVIEKGRYRSYHMPIFYFSALYVDWYCVGEQQAIQELLSDVWAIGKKTVQGWGRVAEWIVEPWSEDWSTWRGTEPMRAIPAASLDKFDMGRVRLHGFRPPYWKAENQTLCLLPTVTG